jgi:hypothetical protein
MAIHQLVLRRTDQRVLRVDNDVREPPRCAKRNDRVLLVLSVFCTFVYAVLTAVYARSV